MDSDERSPLLNSGPEVFGDIKSPGSWRSLPKRVTTALIGTVRLIITTVAFPGQYVIAYFYDDEGRFSPLLPVITICRALNPRKRNKNAQPIAVPAMSEKQDAQATRQTRDRSGNKGRAQKKTKRSPSVASSSSAVITTDSELDEKQPIEPVVEDSPARNTRSKSLAVSANDEIAPSRRSIRIKLHSEDALKRRRKSQAESKGKTESAREADVKDVAAAALKSPTSPASAKLTKFPRAPLPPRPLIPRRQPSYSKAPLTGAPHKKTLIIDLDETLIHSHSKGGRFATGHMVEVKIQHAVGVGGVSIGPQVPILYYVHKRPHCDEFLRKVHKWYNLVIFTASVQEYADPVIDWLELERSYFSGRYYRQHCTQRNGAYIKDLSQVEPDLSKVMIVDNSPVSYIFHEDNAIPIEGWISDPTDNDLLNLIPLLEALQHATDVRAVLALRLGQPQTETMYDG
ncbi:hypothetical protein EJ06DRAFT_479300 [Trichodelitschia bisporula]|uniref:FCP1 homology domain-containing protein n=1 Tax=Trichodelitschia bisporula TaxID=703511 RepID=A0A6G1HTQ8_9PEZI|nr:hypothetical protein EJ06DRAFT_479300 [Trichodelitschia bisporula]